MVARISKVENVIQNLPAGINVGDKPNNLEFIGRRAGKYDSVIQALGILDNMKCVRISLDGATKAAIQAVKWGITSSAKRQGFKKRIKFAWDSNLNILYVWAN